MSTGPGGRPCPACGSTERTVLFTQRFTPVEGATAVTGYDVAVCVRCGCGYADGIPDQRALDQYYREMSKYEYSQRDGAESPHDERRMTIIADLLASRLPRREARILDVGCASGRLLANLRDRGFENVTGLDPSPVCAATALRMYGIAVHGMTLAELGVTGERFDVVILVGVLEHLNDLDEALHHLRALLRPGGLVYLEVPDSTAFADWPNAPYQDFSTEHLTFFGPRSLETALGQRGYAPVWSVQNHREQSFRTVMSNVSALFRMEPTAASHRAM
jgi:SAM-dependent methyltransferase